jgi:hypothetical protein
MRAKERGELVRERERARERGINLPNSEVDEA